jgi:hypothetical protein
LDIIHRLVFYLKHDVSEKESSLLNVVFQIKDMAMDNAQNCDSYRLRLYGPRRDEVTGGWIKLHNELHNLCSSASIIGVAKWRWIRWTGKVARMRENKNIFRLMVGKSERKKERRCSSMHSSEDLFQMPKFVFCIRWTAGLSLVRKWPRSFLILLSPPKLWGNTWNLAIAFPKSRRKFWQSYLKKKSKVIPVTGRGDLYCYEMLRIPHCLNNLFTDGGKFVSPTHLPHSAL